LELDNEPGKAQWVCLSISERYSHLSSYEKVRQEISRIFGKDLVDWLFIGEDLSQKAFSNALETYIFVKSANIHRAKPALKKSKYIKTVLTSYDKIEFIPEAEIKQLKENWQEISEERKERYDYGDVVKVKSGKFEGLTGIIVDKDGADSVVLFKLCTGRRLGTLSENNLIKTVNLFDFFKLPLVCQTGKLDGV